LAFLFPQEIKSSVQNRKRIVFLIGNEFNAYKGSKKY